MMKSHGGMTQMKVKEMRTNEQRTRQINDAVPALQADNA